MRGEIRLIYRTSFKLDLVKFGTIYRCARARTCTRMHTRKRTLPTLHTHTHARTHTPEYTHQLKQNNLVRSVVNSRSRKVLSSDEKW